MYSRQICNMDVRIHPTQMRENPTTMKAKSVCAGEPVAVTLGIPHSTVEHVDTNRKETVDRLIEQFENHPNRDVFLQDFEKAEEIDHFSEKDLITDMGYTEIFELYETSSKRQCPDCAAY